ncbi:MAG: hypothetical protein I4E98_04165 [Planktothrix agardhii KL2]|jgi:hypothetical protein|uniref:hypothetical protein n=1 Tax=Planktothrix agardhii TaxID=1160 RepID=UPI001A1BB07E|nr:hypothetical protein [Planktothrix agardhii]MBG0745783.1 hypothetical protein [Planktothrix agardhii KL2]MCB8752600.1 hypothetical protein [Planktothrix agardhii 1810]MCB8784950.1 hypothetical protein [Planktothrix agardhii 1025]MCF3577359.1 hypothetical protein [Planktothrix agardhii 1812]MCF3579377.1 hypothetical protein [Planktothrix agardhii 1811]
MSQITITDLSFCENSGANVQEIKGGVLVGSVQGVIDAKIKATFRLKPNGISYSIGGAAAGAAAGAASDGSVYTSVGVFTQVS